MNDKSSTENLHPHQDKRRQLSLLAIVFALLLAAMPARTFAQIQLDGNATKGTGSGTDWDEINCGKSGSGIACTTIPSFVPGGGAIALTGLMSDRSEPSAAQFSTGGSKDEQDISNWRHRGGAPPSKDDLSHAYAAAFRDASNHTILAFGMDRYDTSGDAQLGFWFLAENVQPQANGTFSGVHQVGDLLVLVNFSNGGTVPTISVFRWQNGTAQQVISGNTIECNGAIPGGQKFCGITNHLTEAAPWPYENKDTGANQPFPAGAFFEGAIDLTESGLDTCFTGFLAESRSSTSITATLKDFVIDDQQGFPLCSVSVTKACPDAGALISQTEMQFTIRGMVTNSGAATVYDLTLDDAPDADPKPNPGGTGEHFEVVDCTNYLPLSTPASFPIASLAAGASRCYKATITTGLVSPGNTAADTVTLTAKTQDEGGATLHASASATCTPPTVPAQISITKGCATVLEDIGSSIVVKINVSGQICNIGGAGGSDLSNVTLVNKVLGVTTSVSLSSPPNSQNWPDLKLKAVLPNGQGGECRPYSFSYYPSDFPPGNTPGQNEAGGGICFPDIVTVTARDIFSQTQNNVTASDGQSCRLCPTPPGGTACPDPSTATP
jgi:hypothetical protein